MCLLQCGVPEQTSDSKECGRVVGGRSQCCKTHPQGALPSPSASPPARPPLSPGRAPAVRGLPCRVRRLVAARRPLRWAMLLPVHGPRRAAVCPPRAPQPRFLRCHTVGAEDPKRLCVCPRRVTGWDEILTPCRRRWAWVPKSKSQDIFRTLPPSSQNKRMADRSLENSESACPCLSPSRSLSQALRLFPKAKRRRMSTRFPRHRAGLLQSAWGGKSPQNTRTRNVSSPRRSVSGSVTP